MVYDIKEMVYAIEIYVLEVTYLSWTAFLSQWAVTTNQYLFLLSFLFI